MNHRKPNVFIGCLLGLALGVVLIAPVRPAAASSQKSSVIEPMEQECSSGVVCGGSCCNNRSDKCCKGSCIGANDKCQ